MSVELKPGDEVTTVEQIEEAAPIRAKLTVITIGKIPGRCGILRAYLKRRAAREEAKGGSES
jgi:hypothetical protein